MTEINDFQKYLENYFSNVTDFRILEHVTVTAHSHLCAQMQNDFCKNCILSSELNAQTK